LITWSKLLSPVLATALLAGCATTDSRLTSQETQDFDNVSDGTPVTVVN